MAKKEFILECFEVKASDNNPFKNEDFIKRLTQILKNAKNINSIKKDSDNDMEIKESSFISMYSIHDDALFCSFLLMKEGAAINIQNSFLSQKSFSVEDLAKSLQQNSKEISGHIKSNTYFLLTNKYLILKRTSGLGYVDIQDYLNHFLKINNESLPSIVITPCFSNSVDLAEIKSIILKNDFQIQKKSLFKTIEKSLKLQNFFEAQGIKNLNTGDMLSASIIFNIKNFNKDDLCENKLLSQKLLEIFNTNEVVLKDSKGRIIDLNNLRTTKSIKITATNAILLNKEELLSEMSKFLNEVKK